MKTFSIISWAGTGSTLLRFAEGQAVPAEAEKAMYSHVNRNLKGGKGIHPTKHVHH